VHDRRTVIARLALVVVTLVVAAALPAASDTTSVTKTATLDCRDPIGGFIDPPAEYQRFGDQIALVTSRTRSRAMQAAPLDDRPTPFRYFSKTGLLLRTGKGTAELRIPHGERGRLGVSWGNSSRDGIASRVLRVAPCPGGIGYVAFPGGYFVDEPHCARLVVRVRDRDHVTRVGLGAACPGQQPPPPP
jgi:hypothetical protein